MRSIRRHIAHPMLKSLRGGKHRATRASLFALCLFAGAGVLLLSLCLSSPLARAASGLLDPSAAFRFSTHEVPGALKIDFKIADGYYLYRERFAFAVDPARASQVKLGVAQMRPGTVKYDDVFAKNVESYRGDLTITLPIEAATGPFDLTVTSQGCSDQGVCYPPAEHLVHVSGPAVVSAGTSSATSPATSPAAAPAASEALPEASAALYDQDFATRVLSGRSLPAIIVIFFLLGMALSLLPCSLPMIPILSSIILGEGVALTRRRGLALSLAYVFGMAIIYTAFGVAAAVLGHSLGAALQNPWVLGGFALLLAGFALSLLGCYTIQLPAAWQGAVQGVSQRLSGGKVAAVFIMGALSALVVGACMTAPLFGVLTFIAQTGNAVLGGASLFVMALGMGVPLVAVGIGAGTILPRAGRWMDSIKRGFGVLSAAAAVWIVSPVLPTPWHLLLWAVVVALAGFAMAGWGGEHLRHPDVAPPEHAGSGRYTGAAAAGFTGQRLHNAALRSHSSQVAAWQWLGRAGGFVAAAYALMLVIGAASGADDPLRPLALLAPASVKRVAATAPEVGSASVGGNVDRSAATSSSPALPFARIHSSAQLDAALATAKKPVLLFFHADWCTSCVEMERDVFTDPQVSAAMRKFALVQADVTENSAADKALMARFHMFGPPAIFFFDASGTMLTSAQIMGYQPPPVFLQTLQHVWATVAASSTVTSTEPLAVPAASDVSATLGRAIADARHP